MSKISLAATGDSFITRRLPSTHSENFQQVAEVIRKADIRFTNLETTIHNQEGYPAAFSGGTWAMSPPEILQDLKSFGFNVMAWANNHTLDYSHGGLLATKRYLDEAGIIHAGAGENMAEASAPKYIETETQRVALISVTSTFHESGRAGDQRPDMIGRPGIHPLRYETSYTISQDELDFLKNIAKKTDINANRNVFIREGFLPKETEEYFYFGAEKFVVGSSSKKMTTPYEEDIKRINNRILEAKRQSDVVVISIHAHEMEGEDKSIPAKFLEDASRMFIDAGADAIIGHGPHVLRGIEIYQHKPIFYSLGNFIFQNDSVSVLPADFYEKYALDHSNNVSDAFDVRSGNNTKGFSTNKNFWESVIVVWDMEGSQTTNISLYPIKLGYGEPRHKRGLPVLSSDERILEHLQQLSAPYGTTISIKDGVGTISLS